MRILNTPPQIVQNTGRSVNLLLLLILTGALTQMGCSKKIGEPEKIRQLIRSSAKAATEKDIAAVVEWVAKDFQGELGANSEDIGGSIDKRQLRLLLFRFFRRPNAPTVVIRSIDVEVAGSNASAKVLALLAQGGAQAQATRADALKLDLKLEKRDSDWWVVRAKRTPIDPSTLLLGE